MTTIIQKGDLAPTSFSNSNTNNAGGIAVRTDAGSDVVAAITAAITAIPNAADTLRGLVELAVAANYPDNANDVDATTPAYVKAAVDAAIAALPGDKFLQGLQSYDAATNTMTLLMSDGGTVAVDMTALLNDAAAELLTSIRGGANGVSVFGNDGTTLIGYLVSP